MCCLAIKESLAIVAALPIQSSVIGHRNLRTKVHTQEIGSFSFTWHTYTLQLSPRLVRNQTKGLEPENLFTRLLRSYCSSNNVLIGNAVCSSASLKLSSLFS